MLRVTVLLVPDRQRLADALRKRRAELRLTQTAIADRAGVSLATVNQMERRQRDDFRTVTKALIEAVLRWTPGSIDRLLEGGDATPLPEPQLTAVPSTDPSLPSELARMVEQLPAVQQERWTRLARALAETLATETTGLEGEQQGHTVLTVPTDLPGASATAFVDETAARQEEIRQVIARHVDEMINDAMDERRQTGR
jgi:transcriptional regulator with XRE-family HTH domain